MAPHLEIPSENQLMLIPDRRSNGLLSSARVWLLWLPFAIAVSWPGLLWQTRYLAKSGPNLFWAFMGLIVSLPVLLFFWHEVRRLAVAKFEGWLIALFPIAASLLFEPKATLAVLLLGTGGFAMGRRVLRLLNLQFHGPVEEVAVCSGAGLGIFHLVLFGFGLAGWYFPAAFLALILSPIAFCWREVRSLPALLQQIGAAWPRLPGMREFSGTVLSGVSFALLVPAVMVALAPSVYFDMVRIHLPAVAFNLAHHALRVPPYLPYAYYPQSVETVMTMGYALGGQAGAQLSPLLYVALALLTLFRLGRICGFDGFESVAGVLAAVSVPAFHWTAAAGKNDFALMLFVLLALLAFLRWREDGEFNWIYLGVFFVAMAAGVKHIALFALPPLAILYAYAASRQTDRLLSFAKLAGIFLLFGSMWFLRSWIATGNPVFPSGVAAAVSTGTHNHRSLWNVFLERDLWFPWRVHFHGSPYFESISEYPMGITLVMFLPMWLLIRPATRTAAGAAMRATLLFCAGYIFYWLNATAMIRYAIAPFCLLLLFTAALSVRFVRESTTPVRFTVLAAVLYSQVFSTCGILINEVNGPQLAYFAGRIGKQEYLRQALLPYAALQAIRGLASPVDRVLSVGSCSLAYAPNPAAFHCQLLNEAPWNVILQQMKLETYRFLMVPSPLIGKVPAEWDIVYSDRNFTVYTSARHAAWNQSPGNSY